MDDAALIVMGTSRDGHGSGVLKISPVERGWQQRPVHGSRSFMRCLAADYVSDETRQEILEWVKCDLTSFRTVKSSSFYDEQDHPIVVPLAREPLESADANPYPAWTGLSP